MAKEYIEYEGEDFLGNKINIGDTVIFEAPKYRGFVIGKVITKAEKTCQIEYINNWYYPSRERKEVVRQYYCQIIKHTSVADVVEVVRCKDCIHCNQKPYTRCRRDNLWHNGEDFCSYGERKTEND